MQIHAVSTNYQPLGANRAQAEAPRIDRLLASIGLPKRVHSLAEVDEALAKRPDLSIADRIAAKRRLEAAGLLR